MNKPRLLIGENNNLHAYLKELGSYKFKSIVSLGVPTFKSSSIELVINPKASILASMSRVQTKDILASTIGLNVPPYVMVSSIYRDKLFHVSDVANGIGFPVITKSNKTSHKRHEYLPHIHDLGNWLGKASKTSIGEHLLEPFIHYNKELRVYVSPILEGLSVTYSHPTLGIYTREDGVIAVLERVKSGVTLVCQVPLKETTQFTHWERPPQIIINTALIAMKAMKLDIGYVDILYDTLKHKCYITKVGTNPEKSIINEDITTLSGILSVAIRRTIVQKHLQLHGRWQE